MALVYLAYRWRKLPLAISSTILLRSCLFYLERTFLEKKYGEKELSLRSSSTSRLSFPVVPTSRLGVRAPITNRWTNGFIKALARTSGQRNRRLPVARSRRLVTYVNTVGQPESSSGPSSGTSDNYRIQGGDEYHRPWRYHRDYCGRNRYAVLVLPVITAKITAECAYA